MPKPSVKKISRSQAATLESDTDSAREIIQYDIGICSYGSVLVASSIKGICVIYLGEHPDLLVDELKVTFPNSDIVVGSAEYEKTLAAVIKYIQSHEKELGLPLDIRGTEFQQQVWAALCKIPYGETISYTELAMMVGSTNAVRAVANACGANRLAIVIPCHRVVRSDGDIAGYRWGEKIKQQLLEKEKA